MAEKSAVPRNRKLSIVSFDGHNAPQVDLLGNQFGRRLAMTRPESDPRIISASSAVTGVSVASTWSFVTKPAASMQALRNRIIITLDRALQMIQDFEGRYLLNADDDFHGIYAEFVKQLLARIGYKNDLINCEHMETIIIRKFQSEAQISRRSDFKSLALVCARHRAFKEMRTQVQNRLDEVYNYADQFCVTFASETEGLNFESVENYENIKTECLREIRTSLEAVQASSDELRDIAPVSVYLDSYTRVLHHVENVVGNLYTASSYLKKWVVADEQYEKTIEKEIMFLKHKVTRSARDRSAVSSIKYEVKTSKPIASGKLRKVDLSINKNHAAIEKLEGQQRDLNKAISDLQGNQRTTRRQISDLQRKSGRRLNPQSYSDLVPVSDKLKDKMRSLQEREDLMVTKLSAVKDRLASTIRETNLLETEKGKRKKSCDKTAERVAEQTSALRSHSRASGILQQKIEILLKLKSLKLQPETLRKMEFNMINIDYKEAMQDAIWEISNRIGNNWTTIYMKLPFMPERTQEKRAEDIKNIMRTGTHMEKSAAEMGATAFERWAKRSTSATINELVYASKPFTENAKKKEASKKSRYSVPRIKKRFQQLRVKSSVIYV